MESLLSQRHEPHTAVEGYAECAALARAHYENFTVVSWLLHADKRDHLNAIYAFCRTVDDLGDEHVGDRLAALDEWGSRPPPMLRFGASSSLHDRAPGHDSPIRRAHRPIPPSHRRESNGPGDDAPPDFRGPGALLHTFGESRRSSCSLRIRLSR